MFVNYFVKSAMKVVKIATKSVYYVKFLIRMSVIVRFISYFVNISGVSLQFLPVNAGF
ncbi:hypothetical protein GCM10011500_34480 [Mucilaginibacter rubeus]|nr:hypothetical protein GCM10011500_34480 [Mucilaginibacter rubeus]